MSPEPTKLSLEMASMLSLVTFFFVSLNSNNQFLCKAQKFFSLLCFIFYKSFPGKAFVVSLWTLKPVFTFLIWTCFCLFMSFPLLELFVAVFCWRWKPVFTFPLVVFFTFVVQKGWCVVLLWLSIGGLTSEKCCFFLTRFEKKAFEFPHSLLWTNKKGLSLRLPCRLWVFGTM